MDNSPDYTAIKTRLFAAGPLVKMAYDIAVRALPVSNGDDARGELNNLLLAAFVMVESGDPVVTPELLSAVILKETYNAPEMHSGILPMLTADILNGMDVVFFRSTSAGDMARLDPVVEKSIYAVMLSMVIVEMESLLADFSSRSLDSVSAEFNTVVEKETIDPVAGVAKIQFSQGELLQAYLAKRNQDIQFLQCCVASRESGVVVSGVDALHLRYCKALDGMNKVLELGVKQEKTVTPLLKPLLN